MSTFDQRFVQQLAHRRRTDNARAGFSKARLKGGPTLDAATSDFMVAMGAVVPSLMEQLKKMDQAGQTGPVGPDIAAGPSSLLASFNQAGSRDLLDTRASRTVGLGKLGINVAKRMRAVANDALNPSPPIGGRNRILDMAGEDAFDPDSEVGKIEPATVRDWRTSSPTANVWDENTERREAADEASREPGPRRERSGPTIDELAGENPLDPSSAAARRQRDAGQRNPDGTITPTGSDRTEVTPDNPYVRNDDGTASIWTGTGIMTLDEQGNEVLNADEQFQELLDLDAIRREAQFSSIDRDGLGAVYIDVFGAGVESPMARLIERHVANKLDLPGMMQNQAQFDNENGGGIRPNYQAEVINKRTQEIGYIDEVRGTTTVWEFVESLDQLEDAELVQFQEAMWRAGYYEGTPFSYEDGVEPPWGERGTAFWDATEWLLEEVAADNRWSVEEWLARRAASMEAFLGNGGSDGPGGGGGGGGGVTVRLSDPEAVKQAGDRFAQETIGFELSDEDHAALLPFVHDLERQMAGALNAGGEVTEVDVAARIRAWITGRYQDETTARKHNDAWSAIREFVMAGGI